MRNRALPAAKGASLRSQGFYPGVAPPFLWDPTEQVPRVKYRQCS